MCAYSNEFCSGHPLANQVPSALALSHKLETDVLGRAEVQSVDIVSPGFQDRLASPLNIHRKLNDGTGCLATLEGGRKR